MNGLCPLLFPTTLYQHLGVARQHLRSCYARAMSEIDAFPDRGQNASQRCVHLPPARLRSSARVWVGEESYGEEWGRGPVITSGTGNYAVMLQRKGCRAAPRGGVRVPLSGHCSRGRHPSSHHHVALLLFTSWTRTSLPPSIPLTSTA